MKCILKHDSILQFWIVIATLIRTLQVLVHNVTLDLFLFWISLCLKDARELMMDDGGVEFCVTIDRIESREQQQKNAS